MSGLQRKPSVSYQRLHVPLLTPTWSSSRSRFIPSLSKTSQSPLITSMPPRSYPPNEASPALKTRQRETRVEIAQGNEKAWADLLTRRRACKKKYEGIKCDIQEVLGSSESRGEANMQSINKFMTRVMSDARRGLNGENSGQSVGSLKPSPGAELSMGSARRSRPKLLLDEYAPNVRTRLSASGQDSATFDSSLTPDLSLRQGRSATVNEALVLGANARVEAAFDANIQMKTYECDAIKGTSSIVPSKALESIHEGVKLDTLDSLEQIPSQKSRRCCPKPGIERSIWDGADLFHARSPTQMTSRSGLTSKLLLQNPVHRQEPVTLSAEADLNVTDFVTEQPVSGARSSKYKVDSSPSWTVSRRLGALQTSAVIASPTVMESTKDMEHGTSGAVQANTLEHAGQKPAKTQSNVVVSLTCQDNPDPMDNSESGDEDWEYYSDEEASEEDLRTALPVPRTTQKYASPRLSGMSMALLNMFDNTWNYWEDDDDEDETDEPSEGSPYNQNPVPEPNICFWIGEEIQEWISDFNDPEKFRKLNQACLDDLGVSGRFKVHQDAINRTMHSKVRSSKTGLFVASNPNQVWKEISVYLESHPRSAKWERLTGNAFLVTHVEENNNNEGGPVTGTYIYPDLIHVIHGQFEKGKLVQGRYGFIQKVDYVDGIIVPRVTLTSDETFVSDSSTSIRISSEPLKRDPYEHTKVYVDHSGIPYAGEGLYAKQGIESDTLIAMFNGIRVRDYNTSDTTHKSVFTDYKIALSRDVSLDIPKDCERTSKYSATLGHKACHSFTPNAVFREMFHPRFGLIMSLVAANPIRRREEILVNYNYHLELSPVWFRDLYFEHLRSDQEKSEEFLFSLAKKISFTSGVSINVPPPSKSSSRYVPCGACQEHVGLEAFSIACEHCSTWFHVPCLEPKEQNIIKTAATSQDAIQGFIWNCFKCST